MITIYCTKEFYINHVKGEIDLRFRENGWKMLATTLKNASRGKDKRDHIFRVTPQILEHETVKPLLEQEGVQIIHGSGTQ